MQVSFEVKLQPMDLFRFNMYQTYTTMQGPISIILFAILEVIAVVNFRNGEAGYGALYVAAGLLFAGYIPLTLWSRAHSTLKKNQVLANALRYEVSDAGIKVSQNGDEGLLEWNLVYKVVARKKQVLIYSNRVNAYIIPREQLGADYDGFCEICQKNLEKYRLKMK